MTLSIESDTPRWALLLMQLVAAAPEASARIAEYSLADLRLGLKQDRFHVANERAALDLIGGTISAAMRSVALGEVKIPGAPFDEPRTNSAWYASRLYEPHRFGKSSSLAHGGVFVGCVMMPHSDARLVKDIRRTIGWQLVR